MIGLFRDISAARELSIPAHHRKVVGVIGAGGIVSGLTFPPIAKRRCRSMRLRTLIKTEHSRSQKNSLFPMCIAVWRSC